MDRSILAHWYARKITLIMALATVLFLALFAGTATAATFAGGNGPDILVGTNQADNMNGGRGPDTLRGRGGNDRLNGGRGVDLCNGGAGKDIFISCEVRRY